MPLAKRVIPCLDVTAGRVVKGVNFVKLRDAGDPVEIAARYDEQGARRPTGLDAIEWAKKMELAGAGEILLTSMDRDGTRDGFDLGLTRAVSDAVGVPVVASGGVGTMEHFADGVVAGGADAVLAA